MSCGVASSDSNRSAGSPGAAWISRKTSSECAASGAGGVAGLADAVFDAAVVDGGVNGVGWFTRLTANASRLWDIWVIDGLVNVMAFAVKLSSYPMRIIQTGFVQSYAWLITFGVLVFFAYYLLRF